MGVFDNVIASPPPAPADPALAARKAAAVAEANRLMREGFASMVATHNALIDLVNRSPYGLTPGETAEAIGPGGGYLLGFAVKVQEIAGMVASVQCTAPEAAAALFARPADGLTFGIGTNGELTVSKT